MTLSCLLRLVVARLQLEGVRDDREIGHPPALESLVVVLRLGERDEVPHRPGDDVLVRLEVALVLREAARQRRRESRPTDGFSAMMSVLLTTEHHSERDRRSQTRPERATRDRVTLFYRFARLRLSADRAAGCTACGFAASSTCRRPAGSCSRRTTRPTSIPGRSASRSGRGSCTSWPSGAVEAGPAHAAPLGRRVPGAARRGRRGGDRDRGRLCQSTAA